MVGHSYHFLVMFHKKHRVAGIAQALHRVFHQLYVMIMQPCAGFVENVEHIRKRRVDVLGYLASLCLATRKRTYPTVQAEIAQPDFLECRQPCADSCLQVDCQRVGNGFHPLIESGDAQRTSLSDVEGTASTLDFALENARTQTGASAVGAGAHAQHRIQHGSMKESFLAVDDGTVHTRNEAFVLSRLGPVGRRVFQADLRTVQEEVEFFGCVVANLLVKVEKTAVGVAYPSPPALAKGYVVDGVLIVETLIEINKLVYVQLANLAQTRTTRAAALRVVERERLGIAHKRLAHT